MTDLETWPLAAGAEFSRVTDVAVVAANPLMLGGLVHALDGVAGLRVTHRAERIAALRAAEAPALIVVDLYLEMAGQGAVPAGSRVVALCAPGNSPNLLTTIHHGVHAFVSRECDIAELLAALSVANRGGLHVSPELLPEIVEAASTSQESRPQDLSPREIEALQFIAGGFTHGQVSRRMGLTEATVSTYVSRIRHKLRVGNKADLTRRAIELGYVSARKGV
ncbi:response regulator transcription factor [Actinoplanes solisilvae]|uniref:response regulator transcription factor n=1 Tax=Actinoplanes solisilvae TaxID=2486853 RepID=UPI000FDADA44|nr:response regulator transcription factor [Actinoplanes solisilvae]